MENNLFELSASQLKEIAQNFRQKIEIGLAENDTEIRCLPTYISPVIPVKDGKVLALDLGGTNFRAAIVELKNGIATIYPENGISRDLSAEMKPKDKKKMLTRDQLFEKMTDLIGGLDLKGVQNIGYCFSYPIEAVREGEKIGYENGDAILIRWNKGVEIKNTEGKLVGKPLLDYLKKRIKNNSFKNIKVINDTVASLFAGLSQKYDAHIGLIVGTGYNMAPFVRSDKISKLPAALKHSGWIPVNLESGNFHPPFLTTIDEKVDAYSDSKGLQCFEKAISGFYLGKIFQQVFSNDSIEDGFDAKNLTSLINFPDLYKEKYIPIAKQIYNRSAQLVAASIAGLVLVLTQHDKTIKRIGLTAEGSLFWSKINHGLNYEKIVDCELKKLLSEFGLGDVTVSINRIENANFIGSAIAAMS